MMTARQWKAFYRAEREALGEAGLLRLLEDAPAVDLPARGALIFPHTRVSDTGRLTAAAADAVLRSGRSEVLALGVLHGGRESDAGQVQAARGGNSPARIALRRMHGPDVPGDAGCWTEEFSLDNFVALVEAGARRAGKPSPRITVRYPFLVGDNPLDLPGLEELRGMVRRGAAVVATADPIHHGAGYGTPPAERLSREDAKTRLRALASIQRGLDLLRNADWAGFATHCAAERSDFRDVGPVLAALLAETAPGWRAKTQDVMLVDYSDVLKADPPTWVAGALVVLRGGA